MNENRRRSLIVVLLALGGAVFGVAGVGHAYLREWKRALLWFFLALFGGAALVITGMDDTVPSSIFELPPTVTAGIAFLLLFSVVDAYLVSIKTAQSEATGEITTISGDSAEDAQFSGETVTCPNCGRETDAELDFCTWCTQEFSELDHLSGQKAVPESERDSDSGSGIETPFDMEIDVGDESDGETESQETDETAPEEAEQPKSETPADSKDERVSDQDTESKEKTEEERGG